MHVVYLIDSLIAGGAERSLAALAPHVVARGVELQVAYLYERDNVWRPAIEAAGVEVVSLAGESGMMGAARRVRSLLRQQQPELVHTTLYDADIVGRLAMLGSRRPLVSSLVNASYGPEQFANPAIKNWRLRSAQALDIVTARRVKRFHAVSRTVADDMATRLRIPRTRIDVIPRGRDPRELGERTPERRAAARAALSIGTDVPLVLAVGRHEYQKGFDILFHAVASVRQTHANVRLVVAGRDGTATDRLGQQIADLGLGDTVTMLGFRADVPDLLCAADVFVAPSRWEGSPGGVLEAMALETPIVASDIPTVREVVDDSTARLVASEDGAAFARAIVETLGEDSRARTISARERFVDRFTIDRVAAEMVQFYERALGV